MRAVCRSMMNEARILSNQFFEQLLGGFARRRLNSLRRSLVGLFCIHRQPIVEQLIKLRAIGVRSAWRLDKELFGWRRFANRRELAGCVGLAPTPYASGDSEVEQGISKAGNKRVRALLVELAWSWLRLQPESALSQWFTERFARSGKRSRRVGIVALARRLLIALWRYLDRGEIPEEPS
jgi:transposase